MTALVRNSSADILPATSAARGFGVTQAARAQDQIGRAFLTILLVLYPALASAAVAVTAFLLSGSVFSA